MGKRKGHRMSGWRRIAKKFAGAIGSGVIILGLSHGVIQGVVEGREDPMSIPERTLRNYSGVDFSGAFDQKKAVASVIVILAAIGAGLLIKYGARRV